MRASQCIAFVLAAAACLSAPVSAALVAPGQTISTGVDPLDFVVPSGEVIAQNSQDFVIDFDLTGTGYTPAGPTSFNATLTSSVIRDPGTGRLTFAYRWVADDSTVGDERNTFALESFAGFSTDITIPTLSADWVVTRSADGATISGDSVDVGGSLEPDFFIVTDATEFDANGTFSGTAGTELSVIRDEDQVLTFIAPQSLPFSITGTFQPIVDDGGNGGGNGGGGNGGNVIPLPPAGWTGMIALLGSGALAKARRRLRLA